MPIMNAPDGYTFMTIYGIGSNTTHMQVLVCLKCGSMVGDAFQHNSWHGPMTVIHDMDGNQRIWEENKAAFESEMYDPDKQIRRTNAREDVRKEKRTRWSFLRGGGSHPMQRED